MNPNLKLELAMLLEEATLSNFERRKRRLKRIPLDVVMSGLLKISRDKGEPLALEEFIGTHAGFLSGERERLPSNQEYLERLRLGSLPARLEAAPAVTLPAMEAAPNHADDAGNRCEGPRASLPSSVPTFADAPAPPPKTESDRWRARVYHQTGELGWMAR
jgi:hypothetical protein